MQNQKVMSPAKSAPGCSRMCAEISSISSESSSKSGEVSSWSSRLLAAVEEVWKVTEASGTPASVAMRDKMSDLLDSKLDVLRENLMTTLTSRVSLHLKPALHLHCACKDEPCKLLVLVGQGDLMLPLQ